MIKKSFLVSVAPFLLESFKVNGHPPAIRVTYARTIGTRCRPGRRGKVSGNTPLEFQALRGRSHRVWSGGVKKKSPTSA
jgi:hypothetical protein